MINTRIVAHISKTFLNYIKRRNARINRGKSRTMIEPPAVFKMSYRI